MIHLNGRRQFLAHAGAAATTLIMPASALAQSYPSKPIRMVVPYSAGGSSDFIGRLMAQKLGEGLGQQVIVDNKPGAGAVIGTDFVAKSPPDGYTIGQIGLTTVINPSLYKKLPYDTFKDLAPITTAIVSPLVLVVHPDVPAKNVQELIVYAKANPGKLNFGSAGNGNVLHLAGELFKTHAGIDITHIPYKGASAALTDLLGGRLSMMFDVVQTPLAYIQTGKLRALGTTGTQRLAMLPEVPTIAEQGLPGFEFGVWGGFAAPAGTPKSVIARLHAEFAKVLAMPDVQASLAKQGMQATSSASPEAFAQLMASEQKKFADLIKRMGIQPE